MAEKIDKNFEESPVTQNDTKVSGSNDGASNIVKMSSPRPTSTNSTNQSAVTRRLTPEEKLYEKNNQMVNPLHTMGSQEVIAQLGGVTRGLDETYINNPYGAHYFKSKWLGFDMGAVSGTGGDFITGANPFNENYDFEHDRRNSQSMFGAGANIVNQFVGKTAINTVGGIVAGFYGIGSMVANDWDTSKLFDNSVTRGLDRATEFVDQSNSVFTSEHARSQQGALNIFNVEGMKNLGDGMSFVAGAVLSEVILGLASGGIGNAINATAKGASLVRGLTKVNKAIAGSIGKTLSKVGIVAPKSALALRGQAIRRAISISDEIGDISRIGNIDDVVNTLNPLTRTATTTEDLLALQGVMNTIAGLPKAARSVVTGTFWEAGLEARQAKDEFIENNMEAYRNELDLRSDLTEEEKAKMIKAKEKLITQMGNDVGFGVFGLNTIVLQGSNMVQFPTIFGRATDNIPLLGRATNLLKPNYFKRTKESLGEAMYRLRKGSGVRFAARKMASILKNPLAEGLEEMTQSGISDLVTDYYQDKLSAEYQQNLLLEANSSFMEQLGSNILGGLSRVGSQIGKTFTDEEAYKEGVIGLVMGAIGAPTFRKNKNGKLRPHIAGGIYEDIKGASSEWKELKQSLVTLNSQKDDLTSILGMNQAQAVMNKKLSEKDDLASLTADEIQLKQNQEEKTSAYVLKMKKLGLDSQMERTVKDIQEMKDDEYRKAFNKDENYTAEDIKQDKDAFKEAIERYSKAYDTTMSVLNIDTVKRDSNVEKMIDIVANNIGYEKYANQELNRMFEDLDVIKALGEIDMTKDDFISLAEKSNEVVAARALLSKTIKDLSHEAKTKKEAELKTLETDLENYINQLPTNVKSAYKKVKEALDSGNETEVIKAKSILDSVLLAHGSDPNVATTLDVLENISSSERSLREAKNKLDQSTLEELAESEDPNAIKEAKAEIESIAKRLSETLEKEHKENTKDFIQKVKDQKFKEITMNDILDFMRLNKKLDLLENKLIEQEGKIDLSDKLMRNKLKIDNFKNKVLSISNKRLAAYRMVEDLVSMGGSRAYHQIQTDTYNYGIRELNFAIYDARVAQAENDEDGIVVETTRMQELVDKLKAKEIEMLEKGVVTERQLNRSRKVIKQAEELIKTLGGEIAIKDAQDQAKEELDKKNEEARKAQELGAPTATGGLDLEMESSQGEPTTTGDGVVTTTEENKENGEVTEELEETIVNDDAIVAHIEGREVNSASPKIMYTINAAELPGKGIIVNSDIRYPENENPEHSLRSKIDSGKIQYNQAGQLLVPEVDPSDSLKGKELADYYDYIFGVVGEKGVTAEMRADREALYMEGKRLLAEDNWKDLLEVPFDKMNNALKYYISKTRIIQNFYEAQVELDNEADTPVQYTDINDETPIVHSMYLYGANTELSPKHIQETTEMYEKQLAELETKYLLDVAATKKSFEDIESEDNSQLLIKLAELENKLAIQKEQLSAQFKSQLEGQNDYAGFALRLRAIKMAKEGKTLQFRVGNFLNGTIPTAVSTGRDSNGATVARFPLESSDITENPLFNESDPLDLSKLAYVDNNGDLISYETGKKVKVNKGSQLDKSYLSSGKNYALITTSNGQVIPVALNTESLERDDLKPILDEFMEILLDYTKNEHEGKDSPRKIIKLKPDTLFGFAKGMTYEQFVGSMSRSWKSSKGSLTADIGGFVGFKGDTGQITIGQGNLLTASSTDEQVEVMKTIVSRGRVFVNRDSLRMKDPIDPTKTVLNKEYFDFLVKNNILTHTAETSKLFERVFEKPKDKDGNPKPLAFQIHELNTGEFRDDNVIKISNFESKKRLIHKIFFGNIYKESNLDNEVSTGKLVDRTLRGLSSKLINRLGDLSKATDEEIDAAFKDIVESTIKEKMMLAVQLLKISPNMGSDFTFKLLKTNGNLASIKALGKIPDSNNNILDHYLYKMMKELASAYGNKSKMSAIINYASNRETSVELRRKLLSPDNQYVIFQGFDQVSYTTGKGTESKKYLPSSSSAHATTVSGKLRGEVTIMTANINVLQSKLDSVTEIEKGPIQEEIDNLKKKRAELVEQRKELFLDQVKHIFAINEAVGAVYKIEQAFKDSKLLVPHFQMNNKRKDRFSTAEKTFEYSVTDDGGVVKKGNTSGIIEQSSLVPTSNKPAFTLEIKLPGETAMQNFSSTGDLGKVEFDEETGDVKNASLVMNVIRPLSKKETEEQNAANAKTEDKSKRTYYTYKFDPQALFIGSDVDKAYGNVITEIAIPGINADGTVNKDVTLEFLSIATEYKHNIDLFNSILSDSYNSKDEFKLRDKAGIAEGSATSTKGKEAKEENTKVTVPGVIPGLEIIQQSAPEVIVTTKSGLNGVSQITSIEDKIDKLKTEMTMRIANESDPAKQKELQDQFNKELSELESELEDAIGNSVELGGQFFDFDQFEVTDVEDDIDPDVLEEAGEELSETEEEEVTEEMLNQQSEIPNNVSARPENTQSENTMNLSKVLKEFRSDLKDMDGDVDDLMDVVSDLFKQSYGYFQPTQQEIVNFASAVKAEIEDQAMVIKVLDHFAQLSVDSGLFADKNELISIC